VAFTHKKLVEVFAQMQSEGVPRAEADDLLEVDSEDDIDPRAIEAALNEVYGDEPQEIPEFASDEEQFCEYKRRQEEIRRGDL